MMTFKKALSVAAVLGVSATLAACGVEKAEDALSGYTYAIPETQAMQDDNFNNPAMLWVGIAEEEWTNGDGKNGKACADCHGDAEGAKEHDNPKYSIEPVIASMAGVGAEKFPRLNVEKAKDGKVMTSVTTLEEQINACRTDNMQAKAWKWESDQMLGMTALIKMQSRGMPITVSNGYDDPKSEGYKHWKAGKDYFEERRGLMDMACEHCHGDYPGTKIRANTLTQAQINGFPTYRLKWQKPGSLHRRYKGCNKQVRAQDLKRGAPEYKDLEVYMSWRSRGLQVESPSVRN